MENLKQIVGENLTDLRKSKKLTQFELATRFNYSDKAVSKWENGDTLPDLETLNTLCQFYGVSLDYLTHPLEENKRSQVRQPEHQDTYNHIIVTSLLSSVFWIIATIIFVYVLLRNNFGYWLVFVWALPINSIAVLISNRVYFKSKLLTLVFSTLFIWSLIAGAFLQVLQTAEIMMWPLFLIGVPIQVSIILLYLRKK